MMTPFTRASAFASLLALAIVSAGCADDRDDNTPDGGSNTTDGGNNANDGGNNTGDGGQTGDDHGIGAACTGGSSGGAPAQGDCDDGLFCLNYPIFPGGVCSKSCTTDTECGDDNKCAAFTFAGQTVNACAPGCDPLIANACRTGYTCNATGNYCEPGSGGGGPIEGEYAVCNQTTACPTGLECITFQGAADGICLKECTADTGACGSTSSCELSLTTGEKFCARLCFNAATCPSNANACGPVNQGGPSVCVPPAPAGGQQHYQQCSATHGNCVATAACLTMQGAPAGSPGICLTECGAGGSTCVGEDECLDLGIGDFCARPCTDPTTCPTGTTCNQGYCL